MKRLAQYIAALSFIVCLAAKADIPVFGNTTNSTGYAFQLGLPEVIDGEGGAIEFTPTENIDLSSVTLWLSNYTMQSSSYGGGSLYESPPPSNLNPFDLSYLGDFNNATPNNGSIAAFTFELSSGPITLDAGQEYWLIFAASDMGNSSPTIPLPIYWMDGGAFNGDGTYDASYGYRSPGEFSSSTAIPAFTINTVPEPSEYALMGAGVVLFGFRRLKGGVSFVLSKRKCG
jgi:hypothetical protein